MSKTSVLLLFVDLLLLGGRFLAGLLDDLSLNLNSFLIIILGEGFSFLLGWFGLGISGTTGEESIDVYYVLKESPLSLVLLGGQRSLLIIYL
jgi:hypothetical protein